MTEKENTLLILWSFVDLVVLILALVIAYCLNIGDVQNAVHPFHFYLLHVLFSWIVTCFAFSGKRHLYLRDSYKHRVLRIIKKSIIFAGILILTSFFISKGNYSRWFLCSFFVIFTVGKIIAYRLIYILLKKRRERGKSVKKALIVGYTDTAVNLKEMFQNNAMLGYKFVGYVKYAERDIAEIPENDLSLLAGNTSQLEEIIKETKAEVVFSVFSVFQNKNNIQHQLTACNHCGVRLYLIPETAFHFGKHKMEYLGSL